jgi:DNA repair exonuclease SbcCD ATPase subunit
MSSGVRILHFRAENVKRLECVDFEPDRLVNVISGDNGAGKSAVMDSILYALGGKKALPAEPVRRGEKDAKITLDLGEFVVERRITAKGRDYLTIKTRDGLAFGSPQKMLGALMDRIAFDPADWLRKKPKEQRAELLAIAEMSLDIDGNRAERRQRYNDRTLIGRDLKRVEGAIADIGDLEPVPVGASMSAVWEEYQEAQGKAKAVEAQESAVRGTREVVRSAEEELVRFRARVEDGLSKRREAIERAKLELAEQQIALDSALEVKPDLEEIRQRFEAARGSQRLATQHERREELVADRNRYKADVDALTKQVSLLDAELETALEQAKMPVEGLSVGEDEVIFKGLPLNQGSQAEQLRVALAIATAVQEGKEGNKLRIVRIMDGSLLDDNSMALVRTFAEEHDFQVWIERIERDGATIVIEDGAIKAEESEEQELKDHEILFADDPDRPDPLMDDLDDHSSDVEDLERELEG